MRCSTKGSIFCNKLRAVLLQAEKMMNERQGFKLLNSKMWLLLDESYELQNTCWCIWLNLNILFEQISDNARFWMMGTIGSHWLNVEIIIVTGHMAIAEPVHSSNYSNELQVVTSRMDCVNCWYLEAWWQEYLDMNLPNLSLVLMERRSLTGINSNASIREWRENSISSMSQDMGWLSMTGYEEEECCGHMPGYKCKTRATDIVQDVLSSFTMVSEECA
jgi:hypothetical protein